jgi:hypothetical protein
VEKLHWCIEKDCKHGTLNGSLKLGSQYLAEWNKGYAQGRKEALQDLFEVYFYHHDMIDEDEWCLKHLPSVSQVYELWRTVNGNTGIPEGTGSDVEGEPKP